MRSNGWSRCASGCQSFPPKILCVPANLKSAPASFQVLWFPPARASHLLYDAVQMTAGVRVYGWLPHQPGAVLHITGPMQIYCREFLSSSHHLTSDIDIDRALIALQQDIGCHGTQTDDFAWDALRMFVQHFKGIIIDHRLGSPGHMQAEQHHLQGACQGEGRQRQAHKYAAHSQPCWLQTGAAFHSARKPAPAQP